MSIKYINKYLIMEKDLEKFDTTIGLEIEFIRKSDYNLGEIKTDLQKLLGVKIQIEEKHHSAFVPDDKTFKMEPDFSGGANLVELITGPLEYKQARLVIMNILKWIRNNSKVSTTEKCGIHININYPKANYITNIDILKFILTFDEEQVYKRFPDRRDNIYTKSIKSISPIHSNFDFNSIAMAKNNFNYPNTKYYGINFEKLSRGYLEFRYIGGKDYENKVTDILELVDYFILSLKEAYFATYDDKLKKELFDIVNKKKDLFKAGKSFFHFKNIFRNIRVMIDADDNEETIKAHFNKVWERLFPLLMSIPDLNYKVKGLLNYDTDLSILELKDFKFKNAEVLPFGSLFYDCKMINCVINNQQLYYCETTKSDLNDCGTSFCTHNKSRLKGGEHVSDTLNDCYMNGLIHLESCEVTDGIFREGTYANCNMKDSVELIDAEEKTEE